MKFKICSGLLDGIKCESIYMVLNANELIFRNQTARDR